MNQQDLEQICQHMGLGNPKGKPKRVFGGLIHIMWHIETEKGAFAVKELSKLIKFDDDKKAEYEHSEEIARSFCKAGIPAVAALTKNGHSLIELKMGHFLCYPWIDGKTLALKDLTKELLVKMAKVLAQIHQVSLQLFGLKQPRYETTSSSNLVSLIEEANRTTMPFWRMLTEHQALLLKINQHYQEAILVLEKTGVVSHADLDPKNVMWDTAKNPHLIDWESARALNPTYDIIQLALDFSGLAMCSIDLQSFRLMLQTYKVFGGNIEKNLIELVFFAILGNSLNWLAFNIKRSIDCSIGEDERQLAITQVETTMMSIVYLNENLISINNAARI